MRTAPRRFREQEPDSLAHTLPPYRMSPVKRSFRLPWWNMQGTWEIHPLVPRIQRIFMGDYAKFLAGFAFFGARALRGWRAEIINGIRREVALFPLPSSGFSYQK